jgi:hypothetical protein
MSLKIEKEKRYVRVICWDGFTVKGYMHVHPGERVIDFLNNDKDKFIAVTTAEYCYMKEVRSFRLTHETKDKKEVVVLNKESVALIEEIRKK